MAKSNTFCLTSSLRKLSLAPLLANCSRPAPVSWKTTLSRAWVSLQVAWRYILGLEGATLDAQVTPEAAGLLGPCQPELVLFLLGQALQLLWVEVVGDKPLEALHDLATEGVRARGPHGGTRSQGLPGGAWLPLDPLLFSLVGVQGSPGPPAKVSLVGAWLPLDPLPWVAHSPFRGATQTVTNGFARLNGSVRKV